jgi:hypothetical protein
MEGVGAWDLIKEHLQQPEYLHVLINPLPVYGLALGLFATVLALVLSERRAQIVALAIVFVSAFSAWPAAEFGEQAYDRVFSEADHVGDLWLDEHAHRASQVLWVFYGVAALAATALLVPFKWPRTTGPLLLATLVATIAGLGCGGYIALAGGQVRHREFRYGPPPPPRPHQAEHTHF